MICGLVLLVGEDGQLLNMKVGLVGGFCFSFGRVLGGGEGRERVKRREK